MSNSIMRTITLRWAPWSALLLVFFVLSGCHFVIRVNDCFDTYGPGNYFHTNCDITASELVADISIGSSTSSGDDDTDSGNNGSTSSGGDDTNATTNSIPLQWTHPNRSDVAQIQITWTVNGVEMTEDIMGYRDTFTIRGLVSNTTYTFSIVTIDSAGNKSKPVEATFTTPPFAVSFDDESYPFTANGNTLGSMVGSVSATAVEDSSIDITSYVIVGNSEDHSSLFAIDSNTGDITIGATVLDTTEVYRFTVQATSSQGATATAAVTVMARPNPVTNVVATPDANGSDIMLTWTDSVSPDASMVHITWTPAGTTGTAGTRVMQGTRAATITGLNDDTEYTFSVVAEDTVPIVSLPIAVMVSTIDVTDPAPLTAVQATTIADDTTDVKLSWMNSTSADATTISIEWRETGSGLPAEGTRSIAHDGTTSITIKELNSKVDYTFDLTVADDAVDVTGNAAPNLSMVESVSVRTSDIDPPSPVVRPTAVALAGGTEVQLNWFNSGSADASMLDIAWSSSAIGVASGSTSISSVTAATSTHTISGLTPSTPYTFTITVVDTSDNRSATRTVTATTLTN